MRKIFLIKLFFLCIVFIAGTKNVFSQQNPILGNFFIYEKNGKVYLSWQIVAGSTCNGIQIYRSNDGLNFSKVGEIAGICGSSSSAVSYNFTDEKPEPNKINCYRLELGGNGSSKILSVEIINIENGYQIRPNPVVNTAKIYFDNDNNEERQLSVYDANGHMVSESTTEKDFFDFSVGNLPFGIYFFTIAYKDTVKVSGKIIVK